MRKSKLLLILLIFSGFSLVYHAQVNLILSEDEQLQSLSNHFKYESDEIDTLLIYRGFVVNYNYKMRIPNFTIHELTFDQINSQKGEKAKRRSNFFVDDIKLSKSSATNRDYKTSGYDRGHMVPAGDFYWNKNLKDETFTYANVAPQTPNLNRGIWNNLEMITRNKILKDTLNVIVITGSIDSSTETIGPNKVGVPYFFYKIIYFPAANLIYAFLFNNCYCQYSSDFAYYQVRVDDIERISTFDFFDKLDDEIENQLESTKMELKYLLSHD